MTISNECMIYDCHHCGYKTKHIEVMIIHNYLRGKYGYCEEYLS